MPQVRCSARLLTVWSGALAAVGLLSSASSAHAHISFERAGTHLSRYGEGEIKDGPCGRENGTRGEHVYTYEPGQTITISTEEFVPHPGYFRIAFDDDGDDDFVDPRSIDPVDPNRPCPYNQYDQCGKSDFYNNATVLMDNLNPHLAEGVKTWTWEVKLPDIECDHCTLQLIQVMEDTVHGPYSPKGASDEPFYVEDIYHQCIDLVLKRGAPADGGSTALPGDDAGAGSADDAGPGAGPGTGGDGDDDGSGGGGDDGTSSGGGNAAGATDAATDGCSVGAGAHASRGAAGVQALFFALAAWALRRRHRALRCARGG